MDSYSRLLHALLPLVLVGCSGGGSKDGDDTGVEGTESLACVAIAAGAACPDPADVDPATMITAICGAEVLTVDGDGELGGNPAGGTYDSGTEYCCYPVTVDAPENSCTYGRPYVLAGESRLAPTGTGEGWSGGATPRVDELSDEARASLAEAWRAAALDEHAAVAAFARVALDLLAWGAPAHLVARTTQAATEEVEHARLGFALASGYAGAPMRPEGFPLGAQVPVATDLASFAAATAREGCLGETLTTLVALECLARATDPAVRAALQRITSDELGHAQLAWATVRWAIDAGGAPVRRAVAEVFAAAEAGVELPVRLADGPHRDVMVAHGVPDAALARSALDRGLREVVLPAARALLSGRPVAIVERGATALG